MPVTLQNVGKKVSLSHTYDWKELALYALSVGADPKDELDYVYERGQKIVPLFWGAFQGYDDFMASYDYGADNTMTLHYGIELRLYKPITKTEGRIDYSMGITHVYDRGEGKGAIAYVQADAVDEEGDKAFTLITKDIDLSGGGFGGEPHPKSVIEYPDREPDFVVDDFLGAKQTALYRIVNIKAPLHIDPKAAHAAGLDEPIAHGMVTAGYAVRALIKTLFPGHPENLKYLTVRFTASMPLDRPIQTQIWNTGEHKAVFRVINKENGDRVLNYCEVEY